MANRNTIDSLVDNFVPRQPHSLSEFRVIQTTVDLRLGGGRQVILHHGGNAMQNRKVVITSHGGALFARRPPGAPPTQARQRHMMQGFPVPIIFTAKPDHTTWDAPVHEVAKDFMYGPSEARLRTFYRSKSFESGIADVKVAYFPKDKAEHIKKCILKGYDVISIQKNHEMPLSLIIQHFFGVLWTNRDGDVHVQRSDYDYTSVIYHGCRGRWNDVQQIREGLASIDSINISKKTIVLKPEKGKDKLVGWLDNDYRSNLVAVIGKVASIKQEQGTESLSRFCQRLINEKNVTILFYHLRATPPGGVLSAIPDAKQFWPAGNITNIRLEFHGCRENDRNLKEGVFNGFRVLTVKKPLPTTKNSAGLKKIIETFSSSKELFQIFLVGGSERTLGVR